MNNLGFGLQNQSAALNLPQNDAAEQSPAPARRRARPRRARPAPRRRASPFPSGTPANAAPPRRETRPRPRRYLFRRYVRGLSRFPENKFRPMTPSAQTPLFANLTGRAKRDAKRNLLFSFPYYLDIQHIDPARVDALPRTPVQDFLNATHFSELLGITTDAPHYDFYINALAKGIYQKSLGAMRGEMLSQYWQFESIRRELPDNPNYYAEGDAREPLNDIMLFQDCIPGANAPDATNTRILAALAQNIALAEPQAQVPGDIQIPDDLLDVSPKVWLQSRGTSGRQAILDKFPNQSINMRDGGTTVSVNTMRAVRLLSGAAWVSHYPNAEGRAVVRSLQSNPGNTRFSPTAWSNGVEHIALQSILYYYGYWCYLKARATDGEYWTTAFEREVLRPEVCRNPASFFEGWLAELDANAQTGASFRNQLVSRFIAYCSEQGINVAQPAQEAAAPPNQRQSGLFQSPSARLRAAQQRQAAPQRQADSPLENRQLQNMLQLQDQMQQEERQANLRQLNEDLQQDVAIATGREEAPPPPEEEIEVVDIPDEGIVEAEVGVVDIPEGEVPMIDGGDGGFLEPLIEEDEEDTLPASPVAPEPVKKTAPVKTLAYTAGGLAAVGALVYLLRR